jgi:hypothetical protein
LKQRASICSRFIAGAKLPKNLSHVQLLEDHVDLFIDSKSLLVNVVPPLDEVLQSGTAEIMILHFKHLVTLFL